MEALSAEAGSETSAACDGQNKVDTCAGIARQGGGRALSRHREAPLLLPYHACAARDNPLPA
jgi:hypothetical protein